MRRRLARAGGFALIGALVALAGPFGIAHAGPVGAGSVYLSATPTYGVVPLLVHFNLTVPNGTPPNLSWSFGDGSYLNGTGSALLTPSHSYLHNGTFDAEVVASWSTGSLNASVTIVAVSSNLMATISATPTSGYAPLTVAFNATVQGGSPPYRAYDWSFGDGGTGNGPMVQYTFSANGSYAVPLEVTDSGGRTVNATTIVTVLSHTLAVNVSVTPPQGTAPLTVQFAATPSGGSLTYLTPTWEFGDGVNGSGLTVTHEYRIPGWYNVSAREQDSAGDVATDRISYRVAALPLTLSIVSGPDNGSAPLAVGFLADPAGGSMAYATFLWNFSDGSGATGDWVNHTFDRPGEYRVELQVADSWNETAQASVLVQVSAVNGSSAPPPNATVRHDLAPVPPSVWALLAVGGVAVLGSIAWVGRARLRRGRPPRTSGRAPSVDAPVLPSTPTTTPAEVVEDAHPDPGGPARLEPSSAHSVLDGPPVGAEPASIVVGGRVRPTSPGSTAFDSERQLAYRIVRRLAVLPRIGSGGSELQARTQSGMAEELRTTRSAVSKVLRRLAAAGYVVHETAHVPGARRRLRVYRLTPRGERIGHALDERTGPWDAPAEWPGNSPDAS